ncbi:MAG: helix-turn-helix domain-containing protein [bacterium]
MNGSNELTRIGTPDAAQHLGITTRELKSLRKAKRIPFYRIGHRTVSYAVTDLDAFLAGCRVATAGEKKVGSGR